MSDDDKVTSATSAADLVEKNTPANAAQAAIAPAKAEESTGSSPVADKVELAALEQPSDTKPNTKKDPTPKKKKTEIKLDMASLRTFLTKVSKVALRYAPILFFLLVASAYGFVVLRINTLSSAQPSQSDIDAQTTATPVPSVDPNVVKKLESLRDNSQAAQTLFDEARNNPFN
jgi:hypothetical protein